MSFWVFGAVGRQGRREPAEELWCTVAAPGKISRSGRFHGANSTAGCVGFGSPSVTEVCATGVCAWNRSAPRTAQCTSLPVQSGALVQREFASEVEARSHITKTLGVRGGGESLSACSGHSSS